MEEVATRELIAQRDSSHWAMASPCYENREVAGYSVLPAYTAFRFLFLARNS